jgi:hypothetical protein
MYFIMTCLSSEDGYLATLDYDVSDDPDPLRSWMSGERFDIAPPVPVRLTRVPRADTVLAEMWQSPVAVMSDRLHQALLSAGVSNLDVYPAEILDEETGLVHPRFVAFNIVGRIAAAERLTRHDDVLVSAPELSAELIDGALLFRLDEAANAIVVHQSVKRAVESAGIDTMTFIEPSAWAG